MPGPRPAPAPPAGPGADTRPPRAPSRASGPSIDSLGQLPYDSYCIQRTAFPGIARLAYRGPGRPSGGRWGLFCAIFAPESSKPLMPDRQIFYDPQRKRWKRLRRILDITAVVSTLVVAGFIFNVLRSQHLPGVAAPHSPPQLQGIARPLCSPQRQEPAPRAPQNQTQAL